mmetsp:Transcript_30382/g.85012  ORF Transcript_30382/g.85012 Transcript_30382/m.85012 type:complete len:215 (-) Transcript_30382:285-929(-)
MARRSRGRSTDRNCPRRRQQGPLSYQSISTRRPCPRTDSHQGPGFPVLPGARRCGPGPEVARRPGIRPGEWQPGEDPQQESFYRPECRAARSRPGVRPRFWPPARRWCSQQRQPAQPRPPPSGGPHSDQGSRWHRTRLRSTCPLACWTSPPETRLPAGAALGPRRGSAQNGILRRKFAAGAPSLPPIRRTRSWCREPTATGSRGEGGPRKGPRS